MASSGRAKLSTFCHWGVRNACSGLVSSGSIGTLSGVRIAFLPRHGRGHVHSPTTVPYRANIDALKRLEQEGISARAVQLRLLWPFPVDELEAILASAAPLVALECNYSGQMNELLKQQSGRGCDHLVVKYSGRPISGESLCLALQQIHAGRAEARIVLRNPHE